MQLKNEHHTFTGMQRDNSISRQPTSFLYDARNIRLTAREGDTLYTITNEKGTSETDISIEGTYLGHCLLNKYLVVFSKGTGNKPDYIYRIDLETLTEVLLCNDDLKFSLDHPIKAIGSYESQMIQKVYWTDGKNQPRVINIIGEKVGGVETFDYNSKSFDFMRELQLEETVTVKKLVGASGMFAPGVIQYAFTYYTKYGQESNIFYTTPLYYISPKDRGAAPDEKVDNAFKITVTGVDRNFDYLRIYSIQRTSINATPICKRVQDIAIVPSSASSGSTSTDYSTSYIPQVKIGDSYRSDIADINTGESDVTIDGYVYKVFAKNRYSVFSVKAGNNYITWGPNSTYSSRILISIQRVSGNDFKILGKTTSGNVLVDDEMTITDTDTTRGDIFYIDTGVSGNSIDPMELLYKGGEEITAGTIEQKDGTLFLGDIKIKRDSLASIKDNPSYYDPSTHKLSATLGDAESNCLRPLYATINSSEGYEYGSQLTGCDAYGNVGGPCGGFKKGETYRCGVQFQHKSGKWSDPFWINDFTKANNDFTYSNGWLNIPCIKGFLSDSLSSDLIDVGYKKARAVVCFPSYNDRTVLCQGVLNPTVYTENQRFSSKDMLAQSSWFFRPFKPSTSGATFNGGVISSPSTGDTNGFIPHVGHYDNYSPIATDNTVRQVEIQGLYTENDAFKVDGSVLTFHSPDIEFDETFYNTSFENTGFIRRNNAKFTHTLSDISIQTETPTASNSGGGFVHKSFNDASSRGIIAGLFYDDFCLDDDNDSNRSIIPYRLEYSPYKWMVYPWHRSGSLTNDVSRPSNLGVQSSLLKKKVISNLRYAEPSTSYADTSGIFTYTPKMFSSNEIDIIKVDTNISTTIDNQAVTASNIYQGNIDTMLTSNGYYPLFFAFAGNTFDAQDVTTDFDIANVLWGIKAKYIGNETPSRGGIYRYMVPEGSSDWAWVYQDGTAIGNVYQGLAIFKDSVRMRYKSSPHLVCYYSGGITSSAANHFSLPVIDIVKQQNTSTRFGGETLDALMENNWVPCGEPVDLNGTNGTTFYYSYGDTYFQRYDCLKTYAFSPEDENQIVEIGSFMLETHVNIDGRYDRNRGQLNNTNMSPQNFNLMNPVYSQIDNFFSYRILPDDYYTNIQFSNQITWTKEKTSGANVDQWTNVTLGSTYDMDGSKGKVVSLNTWKDKIFCFQKKGVSNILFNSRVQIPASDGVPIEITNSYKVDGYRYISDGIGCNKPELICTTPEGIYFIDSVGGHLFHIGSNLSDVTATHGMNSWFDNNNIDKILYDDVNHDVYLVSENYALCFSELLGQFTSFMDYGGISLIETYDRHVVTFKDSDMYKLFEGPYNNFFGSEETPEFKPWYFTFISNGVDNSLMDFDKIFTNIDYRMDMKDDEGYKHNNSLDYIRVVNEYQDTGICDLKMFTRVNDRPMKYPLKDKNLQKKFREWRIQIPRNAGTVDRIRNPWCKITLGSRNENNYQAVLHDLNVQYYL